MKAHNLFLLFLIPILLISACRKDAEEFSDLNTIPDPIVVIVKGNVLGRIVDENNQAIPNVQITSTQGATTTTDTAGIFFLKDIRLNQKGAYIKAEKEGYFLGSRTFYPQAGSTNYVNIQLIEKVVIGAFEASRGGTFRILPNDVRLDFPANAIINENEQVYSGSVNVLLHWLDPGSEDLYDKMPGDLTGVSLNGEYKALESYGMLAIELEGSNGEKLNLGNGQQAELSFPLPPDFASRAPATIPLWHFDEDRGIWIEEGEAVLEGSHYVGKVSHFSFWNCDDPYTLVKLSGTFIFDVTEQNPLENLTVKVTIQSNGEMGTGQTDHHGFFCGNVPKDEVMTLQLLNECGEEVFSQEIGGFSQDTDLGNIFVSPQQGSLSNKFIRVRGSLVDCFNAPITDGMVTVNYGNQSHAIYLSDSNHFDIRINVCSSTSDLSIMAIALNNQVNSSTTSYSIPDTASSLDAGILWLCNNEPDEYFYLKMDSVFGFFIGVVQNNSVQIGGTGTGLSFINGPFISGSGTAFIALPNNVIIGPQPVDVNTLNIQLTPPGRFFATQCASAMNCSLEEFIITDYGNIGEPIIGYINASAVSFSRVSNSTSSFVTPLHIKFKVTREY